MKRRVINALIVLGFMGAMRVSAQTNPVVVPVDAKSNDKVIQVGNLKPEAVEADYQKTENYKPENHEVENHESENQQAEASKPQLIILGEETEEEQLQEIEERSLEDEENEYANLAIADVTDYVNVRTRANTESEIVGKIYDGAVAQILGVAVEDGEWFHVISGEVEGYIKAEYFIYGQEAADVIDDYVTRYVKVHADRLNVREEADVEAKRVGYLDQDEQALLVENCGDWMKVNYNDDSQGYVSADFVSIVEEFTYAKSIEEERREEERRRELIERQKASEESKPEKAVKAAAPSTQYASNGELRDKIVEYAKQFLGNRYVHGGNSLEDGTDCSGFTSLIYAVFGYSISRTPSGQLSSAGRGIDYSSVQKGDIICYGKDGKCTHVALYIGNGQVIHEANSKKGVVIYSADYDTIIGVRNVID